MFIKLGGFKNKFWPGEDSKLINALINKEKKLIYYDPKTFIYHHRRDNLPGYLKQHRNYGYMRGMFLAHGDFIYHCSNYGIFLLIHNPDRQDDIWNKSGTSDSLWRFDLIRGSYDFIQNKRYSHRNRHNKSSPVNTCSLRGILYKRLYYRKIFLILFVHAFYLKQDI